jgi:hypothetical protein
MTTEEHQAAMCSIALSFMAAIFDLSASAAQAIGSINRQLEASGE